MADLKAKRPLAVVTGASSGIGDHLARIAAGHGYDLVVAADTPLDQAAKDFKTAGADRVDALTVSRAELLDTKVRADMKKDDPAMVARAGFDAMLKGEADVVAGWKSKLQVVASEVLPAQAVAEAHRMLAEPGSAKHNHPEYEEVQPIGPHEEKRS